MQVNIKRVLQLKKPMFSKENEEDLAVTITIRNPKIRKTGRQDFSDYSELMQRINRKGPIHDNCKLTKAVVNDLETYLLRGLPVGQACDMIGVTLNDISNWRRQYPLFDKFLARCQAQTELDALDYMQEAMDGGVWTATAWWLERKWPQRYGRRDFLKQEIYHKYMGFMKVVLEVINEADPHLRATIQEKLRQKKITLEDG